MRRGAERWQGYRRRALAAAVGLGLTLLLLWAVASHDEARRWHLEIDRAAAVATARAAAVQLGVDTTGWRARASSRADWVLGRELAMSSATGAGGEPLDAVRVDVRLIQPGSAGDLLVTVDGAGRLQRYELRSPPAEPEAGAASVAVLEPRELVRRALALTVGDGAPGFLPQDEAAAGIAATTPPAAASGLGGRVLRWRRDVSDLPLEQSLEIEVEAGRVWRVELHTEVVGAMAPWAPRSEPTATIVLVLAALVYAVQWRRYVHPHRGALVAGALAVVWASFHLAVAFDQQLLEAGSLLGLLFARLPRAVLEAGLPALVFFGAGLAAARSRLPERWLTVEEVLRGGVATRAAGRALLLGGGVGLVLALVPYAVAAVVPESLMVAAGDAGTVAARWPALAALVPPAPVALGAYAAFALPVLAVVLRSSIAARLLGILAGALLLAPATPVAGEPLAVLAVTLLLAVGFEQTLRRLDLLAVLAAGYTALAAPRALALLIQPGALRWSGLLALALLALFAAVAGRWACRGAEPRLRVEDLALDRRVLAERERLRAQLSVAREAQSRMLPPAPPAIPGLSIAAVCRPAREVGGDLYDFVPLEAGCWGLAVGDVSGKGMVASLYMTLTKGLLLAAAEHRRGPLEILGEVNRGLRRETDRGTFVTLAYGELDPATGSWSHARAGHNPVLWRRAGRRQTVSLRPRGVALGVVEAGPFAAAMAQETLTLDPGDALFLYTDGLTEAMDEDRHEYGEDRLRAAVGRTDGLAAAAAREVVLADVVAFMGDAPQHDDLTLVVVRYEGAAPASPLPATGGGG